MKQNTTLTLLEKYMNLFYNSERTAKLDKQVVDTLIFNKDKKSPENISIKFHIPIIGKKQQIATGCHNIIKDRVYMCFDCQLHRQAFLCQDCFLQVRHEIKCHYKVIQLPEKLHNFYKCCCGDHNKMSVRGTCPNHGKKILNLQSTLSQQEAGYIVKYLTQCFQVLFILRYHQEILCNRIISLQPLQIRQISKKYYQSLTAYIKDLIHMTPEHTTLIQRCLMTKLTDKQFIQNKQNLNCFKNIRKEETFLGLLLKFKYDIFFSVKGIYELLNSIVNYQSAEFLQLLIKESFYLLANYGSNHLMNQLSGFKKLNCLNCQLYCQVLCQIANKNQIVYPKGRTSQILGFYLESASPNQNLQGKNQQMLNLIPCWKSLRQHKLLTIQNIIKINKSYISSYLMIIIQNKQLFSEILVQLVEQISSKIKIGQDKQNKIVKIPKMNVSQLCNVIGKILIAYVKGNVQKVSEYLLSLKIDTQLCKIMFYYLYELAAEKLNNVAALTLQMFGRYLELLKQKRNEQYIKYCSHWKNHKLQQQPFIEYSAKIINVLIGQQLKNLSKIIPYMNKKPIQLQNILQKKLKQMLYMNRNVAKKQLSYLAKQKCLNFPKANQIIRQYTKYNDKTGYFQYCHQQKHFCYDGVVYNIYGLSFVEGFKFQDNAQEHIISNQARKKVILGLLSSIFQYLSPQFLTKQQQTQKFKIVINNHKYIKWFCLVVLDKIVNGQIPNLREAILDKRRQLQKQNKIMNQQNKTSIEENNLYFLMNINKQYQSQIKKEELSVDEANLMKQQYQNVENAQQKSQNLESQLQQNIINNLKLTQNQVDSPQGIMQQQQKVIQNIIVQTPIQSPVKSQISNQNKISNKRSKLIQKLKAKGSKVLTKHSLHEKQIEQHKETCLICKQQGHHQNSLYYLGAIVKQDPKNIFFEPSLKNYYNIQQCLHVMCEKCFQNNMKGNNAQCPLCKKISNMIFPIIGDTITEKGRNFLQSRMTYQFVQSFNQYHADDFFILILKSLISERISKIFLKIMLNHRKQQPRRLQYYQQFLYKYWNSYEQYEKQYYRIKIQTKLSDRQLTKKQNIMMQQKKSQPRKLIDKIFSSIYIGKFTNKSFQHIWGLLDQLQEQIDENQFQQLLCQIETILQTPIKRKQSHLQGSGKRKKLIQHYFRIPKTVSQVQFQSQKCHQCNKGKTEKTTHYLCIICNKVFCNICGHSIQHGNLVLRVNCSTMMVDYKAKTGTLSKNIFMNLYQDPWNSLQYSHDNYFDYRLNQYQFNNLIYQWLENLK